jgi:hypothetical protein
VIDPQALADIEAIRQLKARYFRLLDTQRWTELVDVFTEDVHVEVEGEAGRQRPPIDGREAFVAMLRELLAGATTTHHGHTAEIEVEGDGATATWAMADDVEFPRGIPGSGADAPGRLRGTGHYHERYARGADGRWRIARLELTRLRTEWSPVT